MPVSRFGRLSTARHRSTPPTSVPPATRHQGKPPKQKAPLLSLRRGVICSARNALAADSLFPLRLTHAIDDLTRCRLIHVKLFGDPRRPVAHGWHTAAAGGVQL